MSAMSSTRLPPNDTCTPRTCTPRSAGDGSGTLFSCGFSSVRNPNSWALAPRPKNSSPVYVWATRPPAISSTWSTSPRRKYRRCSAIIMVLPCAFSWPKSSVNSVIAAGSRLEVGSSNNMIGVVCATAWAQATFCICPPDRVRSDRPAKSVIPTSRNAAADRLRSSSAGTWKFWPANASSESTSVVKNWVRGF